MAWGYWPSSEGGPQGPWWGPRGRSGGDRLGRSSRPPPLSKEVLRGKIQLGVVGNVIFGKVQKTREGGLSDGA